MEGTHGRPGTGEEDLAPKRGAPESHEAGNRRFSYWEADALRGAIEVCEAVWGFDADRGLVKGRTSEEYKRESPAPRLRQMLEEADEGARPG